MYSSGSDKGRASNGSNIICISRSDKQFIVDYRGTLKLTILGCGGTAKAEQRQVAAAISESDTSVGVILGDFIYDKYESPQDFRKYLLEPYSKANFPFFLTLGNHEAGIYKVNDANPIRRNRHHDLAQMVDLLTKGYIQVKEAGKSSALPITINEKITIAGNNHSKFNMNTDYYAIDFINTDRSVNEVTKLIILNSNTLPYDTEQLKWLENQLQAAEKVDHVILALHHPLMTYGKRREDKTDGKLYERFNRERTNQDLTVYAAGPHNDRVKTALKNVIHAASVAPCPFTEGKIRAVFGAHDHMLMTAAGKRFNQFISGGAGGPLQKARPNYLLEGMGKNKIHLYSSNYGYHQLEVNKNNIMVSTYERSEDETFQVTSISTIDTQNNMQTKTVVKQRTDKIRYKSMTTARVYCPVERDIERYGFFYV